MLVALQGPRHCTGTVTAAGATDASRESRTSVAGLRNESTGRAQRRARRVLRFPADGKALLRTLRARGSPARLAAHRRTRRSGPRVVVRAGGGVRSRPQYEAANRRAGRFEEANARAPRRTLGTNPRARAGMGHGGN